MWWFPVSWRGFILEESLKWLALAVERFFNWVISKLYYVISHGVSWHCTCFFNLMLPSIKICFRIRNWGTIRISDHKIAYWLLRRIKLSSMCQKFSFSSFNQCNGNGMSIPQIRWSRIMFFAWDCNEVISYTLTAGELFSGLPKSNKSR